MFTYLDFHYDVERVLLHVGVGELLVEVRIS